MSESISIPGGHAVLKCRLRLPEYYVIEGMHAFVCTLFLNSFFFWVRDRFAYTDTLNLLLAATVGFTYMFIARWGGKLCDRFGYDRQMGWSLVVMASVLFTGWLLPWKAAPFVVQIISTATTAAFWPANEAIIMHAPGGLTMPQRVGLFNVVWSTMGALGFFISGVLFDLNPNLIFITPGVICVAEWIWLRRRTSGTVRAGRAAMELPHSGASVPPAVKQRFMQCAWIGNSAGYLMVMSLVALMPHIGEALGLRPAQAIWLSCTMMFARGGAFALFWRWEGWHYRMRWNAAALVAAPVSLACIFFSAHIPVVFGALVVLGVALGMIYYGSLYYSMDYGEHKGEHGGIHESLIGLGNFVGPLTGAAGSFIAGPRGAAGVVLGVAAAAVSASLVVLSKARGRKAGVVVGQSAANAGTEGT